MTTILEKGHINLWFTLQMELPSYPVIENYSKLHYGVRLYNIYPLTLQIVTEGTICNVHGVLYKYVQ